MKRNGLLVLLVGVLLFGGLGCGGVKVNVETDANYNFGDLKTYSWDTEPYSPLDPLGTEVDVRNRFTNAVNTVLQDKGYELIEEGMGDFVVAMRADVSSRMDGRHTGINYQRSGALLINLKDADTAKVIWSGLGTKTLNQTMDSKKLDAKAMEAVRKILMTFPPKS